MFASFESRTERKYINDNNEVSTAKIDSGTSSSGKTVTFANPFFTGTSLLGGSTTAFLPSIGITIQNAEGGDFFQLSNISGTGFTIKIMQNTNTNFVDRQFTFQAVGYGKGV